MVELNNTDMQGKENLSSREREVVDMLMDCMTSRKCLGLMWKASDMRQKIPQQ